MRTKMMDINKVCLMLHNGDYDIPDVKTVDFTHMLRWSGYDWEEHMQAIKILLLNKNYCPIIQEIMLERLAFGRRDMHTQQMANSCEAMMMDID